MIPCPYCGKQMRNVFEFSDDMKSWAVWHCWDCDLTIVLDAKTEKVDYIWVREENKEK